MAHDVDRFAAFRAWRAEQPAGTYPLEAFGSTWDVPARMPATLWLWMAEAKAAGRSDDSLTDEDALQMLRTVLPPEVLAQWRELPISLTEMVEPVQRLIQYYFSDIGGDVPGEQEAASTPQPPPMPPPSLHAGNSWKPTSSANTASTSEPRSEP